MEKELRKLFYELIERYKDEYAEAHSTNNFMSDFKNIVLRDIPVRLKGKVNPEQYNVESGIGVGRWAKIPWIAILDNRITTSPKNGIYIVYLLNKDKKELYLTLIQGETNVEKENETDLVGELLANDIPNLKYKNKKELLRLRTNIIRNLITCDKDINANTPDTGKEEYDAGCIFYKKYTLNTLPDDEVLYDDLEEFITLYKEYYDVFIAGNHKSKQEEWMPSTEEYNPGLSKEKWIELLHNTEVFTGTALNVMGIFYKNGGQGSCLELEEKYGQTVEYYKMTSIHLAERVIKFTGCPKPEIDGNSKVWPVLFVGRNTTDDERGSFIWKLRPELYEALSEFNILDEKEENQMELSNKEIIEQVKQYISAKGFAYNNGLIENFYLSLKSKPFVILAGTSGTGKTRLVRLFAEAVGATPVNGRYKLVSVRPDWSDSSDLFGHVDLNGNFIAGAITEFVEKAAYDKNNPYFLCLDEMNLARVEYYLSDILSIMETRDYRDGEIVTDDIVLEGHAALTLPENLYIIGTVNMDETTFPFSKKVLDRANTIEFSYVDLLPEFDKVPEPVDVVNVNNSFLRTEYLYLLNCNADEKSKAENICITLQEINEILKYASAHVGYRVRDEIVFYMLNNSNADLLSEEEALDNEILQKIFPRIQGSSSAIRDMICDLFKYCAEDYEGYRTDSGEISKKMEKVLEDKIVRYPKSAEKLIYMMRRYEEDGFTSYWL